MQTNARTVCCRIIKAFLAIFKGIHKPKALCIYIFILYTADRHDVKENKEVTYKYIYIVSHWRSAIESNTVRFRIRMCARKKITIHLFCEGAKSSFVKDKTNSQYQYYFTKVGMMKTTVSKFPFMLLALSQNSRQWNVYVCLWKDLADLYIDRILWQYII